MLTLIAALARNGAIGFRGNLIYHLRADLLRFKALTSGHTVIMGRRTFESLPKGALPNRRNIVLTRQVGVQFAGCETFGSLSAALAACQPADEVFIIGGASLYAEGLERADRLCLTHVDDVPADADVFFPEFDQNAWRIVSSEAHEPETEGGPPFVFVDYERR